MVTTVEERKNGPVDFSSGMSTSSRVSEYSLRGILESLYSSLIRNDTMMVSGNTAHSILSRVDKYLAVSDYLVRPSSNRSSMRLNHKSLIYLIERRICDPRFTFLLWTFLRARLYLSARGQKLYKFSNTGIPHESVLSVILTGIYMLEFDKFMVLLVSISQYERVFYQLGMHGNGFLHNQEGSSIQFSRYLDEHLIGMDADSGPTFSGTLEAFAFHYLWDGISLEVTTRGQSFMGYSFLSREGAGKTRGPRRESLKNIRKVQLSYHSKQCVNRLVSEGFLLKPSTNYIRAISRSDLIHLTDLAILKYFQDVLAGLEGYYLGALRGKGPYFIRLLLRRSCAMTLAHKHKTSSNAIRVKYGARIRIKNFGGVL